MGVCFVFSHHQQLFSVSCRVSVIRSIAASITRLVWPAGCGFTRYCSRWVCLSEQSESCVCDAIVNCISGIWSGPKGFGYMYDTNIEHFWIKRVAQASFVSLELLYASVMDSNAETRYEYEDLVHPRRVWLLALSLVYTPFDRNIFVLFSLFSPFSFLVSEEAYNESH